MAATGAVTYLDFIPSAINPACVICHAVHVGESLYSHLDFSSVVENTTGTIHEVNNGGFAEVICSIGKNGVIPALEVRILCDEVGEGLPFVGGGDEAWSVGTDVCW